MNAIRYLTMWDKITCKAILVRRLSFLLLILFFYIAGIVSQCINLAYMPISKKVVCFVLLLCECGNEARIGETNNNFLYLLRKHSELK